MKHFAIYDRATGVIAQICGHAHFEAVLDVCEASQSAIEMTPGVSDTTHYVKNGGFVAYPSKPSAFHTQWDSGTKTWKDWRSSADLAKQVRQQRASLLAACDWTQLPDAPLTKQQRAAWSAYRGALRDVPAQAKFPASVTWPVAP